MFKKCVEQLGILLFSSQLSTETVQLCVPRHRVRKRQESATLARSLMTLTLYNVRSLMERFTYVLNVTKYQYL